MNYTDNVLIDYQYRHAKSFPAGVLLSKNVLNPLKKHVFYQGFDHKIKDFIDSLYKGTAIGITFDHKIKDFIEVDYYDETPQKRSRKEVQDMLHASGWFIPFKGAK